MFNTYHYTVKPRKRRSKFDNLSEPVVAIRQIIITSKGLAGAKVPCLCSGRQRPVPGMCVELVRRRDLQPIQPEGRVPARFKTERILFESTQFAHAKSPPPPRRRATVNVMRSHSGPPARN